MKPIFLSLMVSLVLGASLGSCSSSSSQPDACTWTAYTAPGCGANAVLTVLPCGNGVDSAVLMDVCTCDGHTLSTSTWGAETPFASFGACADGGTDGQ
jgi:hypothetical protein